MIGRDSSTLDNNMNIGRADSTNAVLHGAWGTIRNTTIQQEMTSYCYLGRICLLLFLLQLHDLFGHLCSIPFTLSLSILRGGDLQTSH